MRIQNDLVYEGIIDGTTSVYMDPKWQDRLGVPDRLVLFVVADGASGTSPTLLVQLEESADQLNWVNCQGTAEIPATSISTSATTVLVGHLGTAFPIPAFIRARIQLGGTSPRARVRLWVTGRDDTMLGAPEDSTAPWQQSPMTPGSYHSM
jgi:hypothetical protein